MQMSQSCTVNMLECNIYITLCFLEYESTEVIFDERGLGACFRGLGRTGTYNRMLSHNYFQGYKVQQSYKRMAISYNTFP